MSRYWPLALYAQKMNSNSQFGSEFALDSIVETVVSALISIPIIFLIAVLLVGIAYFWSRITSFIAWFQSALVQKYSKSHRLRMIVDTIPALGEYLDHLVEDAAEQSSKIPKAVVELWDFSDGDRVLVVLPKQARKIATDGGIQPIDTAHTNLEKENLSDGERCSIVVEFIHGELEISDSSEVRNGREYPDRVVQWRGKFTDSDGNEFELLAKDTVATQLINASNQYNSVTDWEGSNEMEMLDNFRYRFNNLRYTGGGSGADFIADSDTNYDRVPLDEVEPSDMRDFPGFIRPAFQLVISLLRDYPADIHLDYCLDVEFSDREDSEEDIILIDMDGSNQVLQRVEEYPVSIGRHSGLEEAIRLSGGETRRNQTETQNGVTKTTSHGVFAQFEHPFNPAKSCFVISGTHHFATTGIARCVAPMRKAQHLLSEECCRKLIDNKSEQGAIHALTKVHTHNRDIRQPKAEDLEILSNN